MRTHPLALAGVAALGLTAGCAAAPAHPTVAALAPKTAVIQPRPKRAEARAAAAPVTPERPAAPARPAAAEGKGTTPSAEELAEIDSRLRALNLSAIPGRARAPSAPEAFQIEALPRVTIPEPLDGAAAPDAFEGELATELFADWKGAGRPLGLRKGEAPINVRVSLNGHAYGRIRIAYSDGIVNADGSGGASVFCGQAPPGVRKLVPARWEVVSATQKGSIEYRVVNAWFDIERCSATVVTRATVTAPGLAGGMLYAFRQSSEAPSHDDKLALIGPRFLHLATSAVGGDADVTGSSFSRISIPVRRGGGASVIGSVAVSTALDWSKITGIDPAAAGDLVAGVEIVHGVGDPGPLAIAYVRAARPSPPSAPVSRPTGEIQAKSKPLDPFITF